MLNEKQKKHLRSLAHKLNPVVRLGNAGLSEGVLGALEEALEHHELIKVKLPGGDHEQRDAMIQKMIEISGAELVQRIGNVAIMYRRNPEQPRIQLPK